MLKNVNGSLRNNCGFYHSSFTIDFPNSVNERYLTSTKGTDKQLNSINEIHAYMLYDKEIWKKTHREKQYT